MMRAAVSNLIATILIGGYSISLLLSEGLWYLAPLGLLWRIPAIRRPQRNLARGLEVTTYATAALNLNDLLHLPAYAATILLVLLVVHTYQAWPMVGYALPGAVLGGLTAYGAFERIAFDYRLPFGIMVWIAVTLVLVGLRVLLPDSNRGARKHSAHGPRDQD